MLIGIGQTFTKDKKKWQIVDIRDGIYKCETLCKNKEVKEVKEFSKTEIYKFF